MSHIVGTPPDAAGVLELSDERDRWERLVDAAWRQGWRACWNVAYEAGKSDEGAEREAAWRRNADAIVAQLAPDSPQGRLDALRRIRLAEAGCRRDAWEQWHGFFERAREASPGKRNEVQRAAVALSRTWQRAGAA